MTLILILLGFLFILILVTGIILCAQEDTTERTYGNGHKINPDDWEC